MNLQYEVAANQGSFVFVFTYMYYSTCNNVVMYFYEWRFQRRWLSAAMSRRVTALAGVPLYAMSTIAIFIFFGGTHIGWLFFERFFIQGKNPIMTCTAPGELSREKYVFEVVQWPL